MAIVVTNIGLEIAKRSTVMETATEASALCRFAKKFFMILWVLNLFEIRDLERE